MKFKKPKFWDYKKPNFLAYLLLPLTIPIFLKNLLPNKSYNKNINISNTYCFNIIKIFF